jgi:hypothetical protein
MFSKVSDSTGENKSMEKVIMIESTTISGKAYAVVVPQGLVRSFTQGVFIEDILPECIMYPLPLSDPKASAELLASLARKYGNARLLGVPAAVRMFLKEPSRPRKPVTVAAQSPLKSQSAP